MQIKKKGLSGKSKSVVIMNDKIFFSSDKDETADELHHRGMLFRKTGKPKEAISYFDKALKINPHHLDALTNKGHSLGNLGKYNEAISCYDKVLEINPKDIIALINKGLSFHYLSQYEEAVACYDKILENKPLHANTLYHKACSRALQSNYSEALELLEKTINLDPTFKLKASGDLDFKKLRDNQRFRELVQEEKNYLDFQ